VNYADAAKICREVRERMFRCRVDHRKDGICMHNVMIPILEILQTRAYEEVCFKVGSAVQQRVPIQIEILIFVFAMMAKEIPLDLQIFLNARHVPSGMHRCKSRLICP
jgi:hypothetical protein